jgi:hypothetical protein
MRDLSLHLLDLAENSIRAQATVVTVRVEEVPSRNSLVLTIEDNGKGMDEAFLESVMSPFSTTRTTRNVGLGIPLMKATAERAGGTLTLESVVGQGTRIQASMEYENIDRPPLGRVEDTIVSLMSFQHDIDIHFVYVYETQEFQFNTEEIKGIYTDLDYYPAEVLSWVKAYLLENMEEQKSQKPNKA